MRKIKEVIRLKFEADLSHDRIAAATYLQRAREVGLDWPLPEALDDAQLEALLFPRARPLVAQYVEPAFAQLHQESKRKGVTLQLLWEEYAAAHPGQAYRYSQFCLLFKRFQSRLKRSMRQVHRAGDKLFIDYSGDTVAIIDGATGEIRRAEIFVAVLGASCYTYAEASWSQQLPDWIGSHVRCFRVPGLRARSVGARSTEERDQARLPLRTRVDLNVRGSRPSLRHGDPASAPCAPPRQGARGGERTRGAALDSRAAAQPAVLLSRRAQRRDPRTAR